MNSVRWVYGPNADTEEDAKRASDMGAEGIGLCRTEHMFLGHDRLPIVRQMLLNASAAQDVEEDREDDGSESNLTLFNKALTNLEELQKSDFTAILRVMGTRPVIVRLLDAPLHEFLPQRDNLLSELTELKASNASLSEISNKESMLQHVETLRESNPMLGHRGCRVGDNIPINI